MKINNIITRPGSIILSSLVVLCMLLINSCQTTTKHKALIITGQSTHDWERSTDALGTILENSGFFQVDITQSPAEGEEMSGFNPDFASYELIVLDYNGEPWPEQIRSAFTEYVTSGGGVVIYHSSSMAFPEWEEYNEITGLGGWGDRNETSGPYCYWKDGEIVKDSSPGSAGQHGDPEEFVVVHRDLEHPILKGLPDSWLHGEDELYGALRGPAENMNVLATAYSDTAKGGTGRDEPVLFTVSYGDGRIFHTTLGHVEKEGGLQAMECAGFIITLQRGAEWAATGQVTQSIHPDFPNSVSTFFWDEFRPLTMDELMEKIAGYQIGKSRKYLADLSNRIRKSDGTLETLMGFEKKMVAVCESDATTECKNYLCRELSWMGSEYCIPTLEKLIEDPETAEMADFALTRLQQ